MPGGVIVVILVDGMLFGRFLWGLLGAGIGTLLRSGLWAGVCVFTGCF